MADEKVTEQQPLQWIPSPNYRVIHSNFFRYRFNLGEMTLHFDTVTDLGPASPQPTIIGEISVAMSWPQVKSLLRTLQLAIPVIEAEIGEIVTPAVSEEAIETEGRRIAELLRFLYSQQPKQP